MYNRYGQEWRYQTFRTVRPISIPNLIKFWKFFFFRNGHSSLRSFYRTAQCPPPTCLSHCRYFKEDPPKDVPAQIYLLLIWIRIQHVQSEIVQSTKWHVPHPLSSVLRWCDLLSPWHTSVQVSSYLRFQLKWLKFVQYTMCKKLTSMHIDTCCLIL